jgi:arylsulfatase A-like enzyme
MGSIFFYVIDSLRYDHVGLVEAGESLTPNIDSLGSEGAVFSNTMAQATWSKPSAASMFTGIYPAALGMVPRLVGSDTKSSRIGLPANASTMASLFRAIGFRTAAFTANPYVAERFGLHQGFDEIPDMYEHAAVQAREALNQGLKERLNRRRVPAIVTGRDLHQALTESSLLSGQDSFILLWSMDTHPPLFDRGRIDGLQSDDPELINTVISARDRLDLVRSTYRKMVRFADAQLGALIRELKARSQFDSSLVVVTADHGESFGENGIYGHAGFPYETQIHVPLIIKFPGGRHAGQVCTELTGLIDLLPTLAEWYQLDLATPVDGQSLLPTLRGEAKGHDHLVVFDQTRDDRWDYVGVRTVEKNFIARMHRKGDRLPFTHRLRMVRFYLTSIAARQRLQMLRSIDLGPFYPVEEELYDLQVDPQELQNRIHARDEHEHAIWSRGRILEFISAAESHFRSRFGKESVAQVDERVKQRLSDLGYLD